MKSEEGQAAIRTARSLGAGMRLRASDRGGDGATAKREEGSMMDHALVAWCWKGVEEGGCVEEEYRGRVVGSAVF